MSESRESKELKACPACGFYADLKVKDDGLHIHCTHCVIRTDEYGYDYDSIDQAIKQCEDAWNTRAPIDHKKEIKMTETAKELLSREFFGLKDHIERKRIAIENEEKRLVEVKMGYEEDIKRMQDLHRDLELDGVVLGDDLQKLLKGNLDG